jgi:hypothetical protein
LGAHVPPGLSFVLVVRSPVNSTSGCRRFRIFDLDPNFRLAI